MFDRILPLLNEVEKQELNDLQERNKPYQDPEEGDENIGQPTATSEISQDEVKIGSSKKSTKSNLGRKNITCTSKMRLNTHSVRTSKMHAKTLPRPLRPAFGCLVGAACWEKRDMLKNWPLEKNPHF